MRTRTISAALAITAAVWLGIAPPASAHPLGNFTVNRAIAVEIGASVTVRAVLDLAEIPAYETIREIDTDGDDAVSDAEGSPYADATCAAWGAAIEASVDREPVALIRAAPPNLTFPDGAGGLPTLRLECHFELPQPGEHDRHSLELRDTTLDERIGWREVSASAAPGAVIEGSSVPAESETDLLTTYPEASLASPPDVRSASLTFTLGSDHSSAPAPGGAVAARDTADDPLAGLIGGQLSPPLVVLAILMSIGLGAVHALSPGHGKTLVAAYVIGAGGSARSAVQIGLWVAISHTAGVFVLGLVTLVASRYLLPERLIAWLSLGSGVIVTGLGIFLLGRVVRRVGRVRAASSDHHDHPHDHPHDHGHDHGHDHPHTHPDPAGGRLSWRAAIALGFAGGAVPSASALIVFLVALATDRLALGMLLIVCFGLGMAGVLGGLAFAVARLRAIASDPTRWPMRPLTQRLAALAPVAAGLVVLATGIAFTVAAASRLA